MRFLFRDRGHGLSRLHFTQEPSAENERLLQIFSLRIIFLCIYVYTYDYLINLPKRFRKKRNSVGIGIRINLIKRAELRVDSIEENGTTEPGYLAAHVSLVVFAGIAYCHLRGKFCRHG